MEDLNKMKLSRKKTIVENVDEMTNTIKVELSTVLVHTKNEKYLHALEVVTDILRHTETLALLLLTQKALDE